MTIQFSESAAKYYAAPPKKYTQNEPRQLLITGNVVGTFTAIAGTAFAVTTVQNADKYYESKTQLEKELSQSTEKTPHIHELEIMAQAYGHSTHVSAIATTLTLVNGILFYILARKLSKMA